MQEGTDFFEYMGAGFDADRDAPLDDGWGHEFAPGSTPPEFDTRKEQEIDRL